MGSTSRIWRSDSHERFVEGIVKEVQGIVDEAGIVGTVNGRQKHFFSIYKKMVNQNKTFAIARNIFRRFSA